MLALTVALLGWHMHHTQSFYEFTYPTGTEHRSAWNLFAYSSYYIRYIHHFNVNKCEFRSRQTYLPAFPATNLWSLPNKNNIIPIMKFKNQFFPSTRFPTACNILPHYTGTPHTSSRYTHTPNTSTKSNNVRCWA